MEESDETGLAAGAAWINGTVMPIAEARLPINDWGIIHSDITYDVVPAWDGGFFRLHDYIGRFQNSVAALRLEIGRDRAAIATALTANVHDFNVRGTEPEWMYSNEVDVFEAGITMYSPSYRSSGTPQLRMPEAIRTAAR